MNEHLIYDKKKCSRKKVPEPTARNNYKLTLVTSEASFGNKEQYFIERVISIYKDWI